MDNIDVRFGVSNVFDKDPPLLTSAITNGSQNNSFVAYDAFGRQFFFGVTPKF